VARAISMRHTIVPPPDREAFRVKARRAQAHYADAGCHYWLFEEVSMAGAYVEFFEAHDPDTLQRAHRGAPDPRTESARMYVEQDLS
jgi:hypothetical protein